MNKLSPHVDIKCKFYPPTYFKHWEGRDEFLLLIGCVSEVFGKSFQYHRQWLSNDGKEWACEFSAEIETSGKVIQGIDLVSLNEQGQICDFKVLARPPNTVSLLKDAMMKKVPMRLALLKTKQTLSGLF